MALLRHLLSLSPSASALREAKQLLSLLLAAGRMRLALRLQRQLAAHVAAQQQAAQRLEEVVRREGPTEERLLPLLKEAQADARDTGWQNDVLTLVDSHRAPKPGSHTS